MPEYLAPGVYVEEVSFRSKSIEGVSTSTCAFVGSTRKGPFGGVPEVITSVGEFERMYGGLGNLGYSTQADIDPDVPNYVAHAVRAFFDNGGKRLYVARTFSPRVDGFGAIASDGIATATVFASAGNRAEFVARAPGSGLNGVVRAYQKKTRVTAVTMRSAPEGSLLCVGGATPAAAAVVAGGAPTFALNNGDQLNLLASAVPVSITFQGAAAEQVGAVIVAPVVLAADTSLAVQVNGAAQIVNFAAGSYSLADILSVLNAGLVGAYARLQGADRLAIGTDRRGTSATISVGPSVEFGFGIAISTGTGNVANLGAVTVGEIDALLQAAGGAVRASLPPSGGVLTLSTAATGAAATLQVQNTPARGALGLPASLAQGVDGVSALYYEKRGQSWVGGADGVTTLDVGALGGADLVTLNLQAIDADGSVMPYDELGFAATHPIWVGQVLAMNPARRSDALANPFGLRVTGTVSAFDLRTALFGNLSENTFVLAGGNDGAEPGLAAYTAALAQLERVEDISIVAAPGHSALNTSSFEAVQQGLISHAERMRYRVAVLDTPAAQTVGEARDTRSKIDTSRAALYYPWVVVANPLARPGNERIKREIALPPSGFVCGIYARTDVERGVWKPPANEVVRGALRFELELTHGQQEVLNPEGVNCLRFFFGRGNRVWGARTASSDPEWKYVNVRRFFIYLERSIDRSTQWAVFEPNNERLWANIRETVSSFLYNEWRNGALLGTRPEEAYFVRCDRSTMTQNDLDNGRLVCEIGVAAVKPAEFVIFRIGQKTADARS